jgi:hypothetical protein
MEWDEISKLAPLALFFFIWVMGKLFNHQDQEEEPKKQKGRLNEIQKEIRKLTTSRQQQKQPHEQVLPRHTHVSNETHSAPPIQNKVPVIQEHLEKQKKKLRETSKYRKEILKTTQSQISEKTEAFPTNILTQLECPNELRKAFVYLEILSSPIAFRERKVPHSL